MNKQKFIPTLALMGLTALVPATLAAQENRPDASQEAEQAEAMSQPGSRSASPDSGLTLTGEVIAMDQQALRVRTATGVENVILTNRTDKADGIAIGDQVRVDFTRSSQGVMIATQVRELSGAQAGATNQQPMSGAEVMGHAAHGSTATSGSTATGASGTSGSTASGSAGSQQQGMSEVSSTGAQAEDTGDPVESTVTREDPRTNSATAPTQGQSLTQTGTATGQSGTTGSTTDAMGSTGTTGSTTGSAYGSTTGSTATGSSYGSTTGSAGTASDDGDQSASADTETGMAGDTGTAGELPDTGGNLPLAGLAGLLALGLASVVRSLR